MLSGEDITESDARCGTAALNIFQIGGRCSYGVLLVESWGYSDGYLLSAALV